MDKSAVIFHTDFLAQNSVKTFLFSQFSIHIAFFINPLFAIIASLNILGSHLFRGTRSSVIDIGATLKKQRHPNEDADS